MNDFFRSHVDAPHGNVHAGNGTQINYQYFSHESTSREQRYHPLALDHLGWLQRRFVPPGGLGQARQIIAETGTVLINGPEGSGRNAAARMLLFEYRELRQNLREVVPEDESGEDRLDHRQVGQGEGLLLDLSRASGAKWTWLHDALPPYHAQVRAQGCRLAVIMPAAPPGKLHGHLGLHIADIERPDGLRALRLALDRDGVTEELPDPLPDGIAGFLKSRHLNEIGELARLIDVASRTRPADGIAAWCATALRAFNWTPALVADKIDALENGRQRALLLTTAMLDGARSDAVHAACEALLDTVGHPEDERPLLEREDLSKLFDRIKAAPDALGRVTLDDSGYAAAVRAHVWSYLPGLRARWGNWVGRVVTLPTLLDEDRAELVTRFAEQILSTGQVEELLAHIRAWADRPESTAQAAAVQALAFGTTHPDVGSRFRNELYQWSTTARVSRGRARVLVQVCTGTLAERFPDQALVRLHHLVRRNPQDKEAKDRLVRFALSGHRVHRLLLWRLAQGPEGPQHPMDIRLFVAAAEPDALTDPRDRPRALLHEKAVRGDLVRGWAALFDHVPPQDWADRLDSWLTAADRAGPPERDRFIDILVAACQRHPVSLGRLYHLARPHSVAPLLLRRIDAEQGVSPA